MTDPADDALSDAEMGAPATAAVALSTDDAIDDVEMGLDPAAVADINWRADQEAKLAADVAEQAKRDESNAFLKSGFEAALKDPDEEGGIQKLATHFGISTSAAATYKADLDIAYKAAQFDPEKFQQDEPELTAMMLKHRDTVKTVVKDVPVSKLVRAFRAAGDLWGDVMDVPSVQAAITLLTAGAYGPDDTAPKSGSAAETDLYTEKMAARPAERETRDAPRKGTFVDNAGAKYIREHAPHLAPFGELSQNWEGLAIAKLSSDVANSVLLGLDDASTADIERQVIDRQQANPRLDLGDTGTFGEVLAGSASTSFVLTPAKTGRGSVDYGLGLLAAPAAGLLASKPGGKYLVGGILAKGTFQLEQGSTYDESAAWRTDASQPLTKRERAASATVYAAASTAIEMGEFGLLAGLGKSAGAFRMAGGKEGFKTAFRALTLRSPEFRGLLLRAGAALVGEPAEEGTQALTQAAVSYFARSLKQGEFQQRGIGKTEVEDALEQAGAVLPFSVAQTATAAAIGRVSGALDHANNVEGNGQATAIATTKDSITLAAAPAAVAEMIHDITAKTGNPVTHLYVDAEILATTALFQSTDNAEGKSDTVEDLLGPGGAAKLADARAIGGKVEIPAELYLQKWAGTATAEKLAEHTTVRAGHLTPAQIREKPELIAEQAKLVVEEAERVEQLRQESEADFSALEGSLVDREVLGKNGKRRKLGKDGSKKIGNLFRAVYNTTAASFGHEVARKEIDAARIEIADTDGSLDGLLQDVEKDVHPLVSRAAVEDPVQRATDINIDPVTNLRSFEAWNASPRQEGKQVAVITLPDVKPVNDSPVGGHDTANALFAHIAPIVQAADAEAARKGTNFLFHGDADSLAAVVAAVQKALPKGMVVEGALAADASNPFAELDASVDAKRVVGDLPARGQTNFELSTLPQVEASLKPTTAQPNLSPQMLKAAARLTTAQMAKTYLDANTPGLLSAAGWHHTPRKKFVASIDVKGLRAFMDGLSWADKTAKRDAGDQLLRFIEAMMVKHGGHTVDAAHLSGDEYAAQSDDREDLQAWLDGLEAVLHLRGAYVNLGGHVRIEKTGIRAGIGEGSYGAADRVVNAAKALERPGVGPVVPGRDVLEARRASALRRGSAGQVVVDRRGDGPQGAEAADDGSARRSDGELTLYEQNPQPDESIAETRAAIGRMKNVTGRTWATNQLHFILAGSNGVRPAAGGLSDRQRDAISKLLLDAGFPDPDLQFAPDGSLRFPKVVRKSAKAAAKKGKGKSSKSIGEKIAFQNQIRGRSNTGKGELFQSPVSYWRIHHAGVNPLTELTDPSRKQKSRLWVDNGDNDSRPGVSAMPDLESLLGYLEGRGTTVDEDTVLVHFEGEASEAKDFDAEAGAVLAWPTKILEVRRPTRAEYRRITKTTYRLPGKSANETPLFLAGPLPAWLKNQQEAANQAAGDISKADALLAGPSSDPRGSVRHVRQGMRGRSNTGKGELFQLPTPEESMRAMEALQIFLDAMREKGARAVDGATTTPPTLEPRALEEERAARQEGGDRRTDITPRLDAAEEANINAGGYAPGEWGGPRGFGDVASASIRAAIKASPSKDPEGSALDNIDQIPKSKNLPGQAELEAYLVALNKDPDRLFQESQLAGAVKAALAGDLSKADALLAGPSSDPRGSVRHVRQGMRDIFLIALNPNADLSTFLHEGGHVFLELFADLAARPDAPEQVKKDWADTLAYLGPALPERNAQGWSFTREQHEKWADSFLAYLREGKAPSKALSSSFKRFSDWLMSIYKSVSQLGIELSPEIRGVFDRLLATEEEIDVMRRSMGRPLFGSLAEALAAGLSPTKYAEWLEDRAAANSHAERSAKLAINRERLKKGEKAWKEEFAAEVEKAEAEYEDLPARQAAVIILQETRIGDLGGQGFDPGAASGTKLSLNREQVEAVVGVAASRRFRLSKDGADIDEVANTLSGLGFATGAEMLKAIEVLPEKGVWSKKLAEHRMGEKHPGVLEDRAKLAEMVGKGLHGDETERSLLKEIEALTAKAPDGSRPVEAIALAAKQMVARTPVGKLNATKALQHERRAANIAVRELAKGNFGEVLVQKHRQLLAMYTYRETQKAIEERDSFVDLAKVLSKQPSRERLGLASPIYRDAVDFLLEAFGLKEVPAAPTQGDLDAAVGLLGDDAATVGFDIDELKDLLARRGMNGWADLPLERLRVLSVALRNFQAAAQGRNTVIGAERKAEKRAVVADLIAEWEKNQNRKAAPGTEESDTLLERAGGAVNFLDGALLRPNTMLGDLAGGDLNGPTHEFIIQPLRNAKHAEADLLNNVAAKVIGAFEAVPKSVRARFMEKFDGVAAFPGHRPDFQPPRRRYELLMMLLNSGNASNLERLLVGRGITYDQLNAALNTLTKEELDWAQGIWDANESLRPLAFALEERDSGVAPPRIEPRELVLAAGKLKGGYMPAVYDRRVEQAGERQAAQVLASLFDPSYTRGGTAQGHLQKRTEGFTGCISLSPGVIYGHIGQVVHDIAFREVLKSVGGLVLDKELDAALKQRLGDGKATQFLQWVKDIGSMRGQMSAAMSGFNTIASWMRGNMAPAVLGWSQTTAIGDLANLPTAVAATPLKMRFLGAGLSEFVRDREGSRAFALSKSGELRFQADTLQRDFAKNVKKLTARGPLARGPLAWWKDHAFVFMEMSSAATATPIWLGSYRQGLRAGLDDAAAVKFADDILNQSFPSHSPVDQAAILRDKGFWGMSTMFYGYLNTAYNMQHVILRPIFNREFSQSSGGKKAATIARASGSMFAFYLAYSVLGELLMGRGPEAGDDDEEDDDVNLGRTGNWLMRKMLVAPLATLPFEAGAIVERGLMHKQSSVRAAPINAYQKELGDAVMRVFDGDTEVEKKILSTAKILGMTFGIPTRPIGTTGKYIYDSLNGAEPQSPADVASGLIYGKRAGQAQNPITFVTDD